MSATDTPAILPSLRYRAMRLRWCGLALRAFIARWGVYLLITGLVLSAGASGWEQVLQAVAAVLVLPLFAATQHGWLLLPALLLQALAGAAAVWGARSLLWPTRWAESERALPLPPAETWRSDLQVVLLVLTPLLLLYVAGSLSVLTHRPAWLRATQGLALAALAVSAVGSVLLGIALLQRQRVYRAGSRPRSTLDGVATQNSATVRMTTWRALVLLPLWRGPARRTGEMLVLGSGALVALAGLPATLRLAAAWPWVLAAWSTIALVVATRVRHLAHLEWADLQTATAMMPIDARRLRRTLATLGLWPLLPGMTALLALIGWRPPPGLRPLVLSAWALCCVLVCCVEVFSGEQLPADKSARWWFSLILGVCLASEVLA